MSNFEKLLADHYADPFHRGTCESATHAADGECAATGCKLRIELAIDDRGTLIDAWFDGDGCCLCEGQTSIFLEHLQQCSVGELIATPFEKLLAETDLADLMAYSTELPKINAGHSVAEASGDNANTSSKPVKAGCFSEASKCLRLPYETLLSACSSPLAELEDDLAEGSQFGGPSLREEC